MDGVGVAEQVVEVAQDLLVGADEEHPDVVLVAVERVELERVLDVPELDELVHLAVGVAGQVGDDSSPRGPLVEPVERHGRKELLHRPVVGRRLEDGKVAVIGVGQALLQPFQVVRHVVELADDLEDRLAAAPEELLDSRPAPQVEQADVEQAGGLFLELERVVVGLLEVLAGDRAPGLDELVDDRVLVLLDFGG